MIATLVSPNPTPGGRFGCSVAAVDFEAFVGAVGEALTQGRAYHTRSFSSYERVPDHEANKIITERKEEKEEVQA